jgi:hypothetical protein
VQLNILTEKSIIGMRLFNALILTLYVLCMMFDTFTDGGSGLLRTVTLILALVDFSLFGYVIATRLSSYLNFPIFGLPSYLKAPEGEKKPETKTSKLESSVEDSSENRVEPKDVEQGNYPNYPVDLEFDEEP